MKVKKDGVVFVFVCRATDRKNCRKQTSTNHRQPAGARQHRDITAATQETLMDRVTYKTWSMIGIVKLDGSGVHVFWMSLSNYNCWSQLVTEDNVNDANTILREMQSNAMAKHIMKMIRKVRERHLAIHLQKIQWENPRYYWNGPRFGNFFYKK